MKLRLPVRAGNAKLMQGDINDIVDVQIDISQSQGFSGQCSNDLVRLNSNQSGATELFGQYTDLAVQSLLNCPLSDIIPGEDIVNNTGRRVEINAQPCVEVAAQRQAFEATCRTRSAQVCDISFSQLFNYEAPQNSFEILTAYDLYYCIPDSCDAGEVQSLGVQLVSAIDSLQILFEDQGTSFFGAQSVCYSEDGLPLDFNGGSGFATGLTISGNGLVSPNAPAAAVMFSVLADTGNQLVQTPEVALKVTNGLLGENWAKAACATLNTNPDFAQFACLCDVSERVPANGPFNMTIYCPFDEDQLRFLCRADPNSEDNQSSIDNPVPCTDFNGLGISLSGSTIPFETELMITNPLPPTNENIPRTIPTFINGNTNPPQINVGNGQAPPLVDILNGPVDGVSSTRPTFIVAGVCAIVTFFSSRF